jgi:hypothetical protein
MNRPFFAFLVSRYPRAFAPSPPALGVIVSAGCASVPAAPTAADPAKAGAPPPRPQPPRRPASRSRSPK